MRRGIDQSSLSFCHVRIEQEASDLQTKKRALTRHHICQHLDLGRPSLQNFEQYISVVYNNHPVCDIFFYSSLKRLRHFLIRLLGGLKETFYVKLTAWSQAPWAHSLKNYSINSWINYSSKEENEKKSKPTKKADCRKGTEMVTAFPLSSKIMG